MGTGVWESDVTVGAPKTGRIGPLRRIGRALATLPLGGLTTMEVLAVAVGVLAVMGFLWASDTVEPERLITGPGFRAAWIILVLALVRPLTWIPYLVLFLPFRRLFDALLLRRRAILRNAVANLATIGVLSGVMWLVVSAIEGAGTAILSALAFATGSGSFDTLGSFRGDWTLTRSAIVVGSVVVVRICLPPLGRDLDLAGEPVLGFVRGARGTFDRYVVLVAVVAGAGVGLAAYLVGRS